ncbi:MAG: hypothetical protein IVW54_20480 [Candidatus Binataceae bacterium]|nr:hypothetical protein [Candidatus Binataceae bacterium]
MGALMNFNISPDAWSSPEQSWTLIDPCASLQGTFFDTDQMFAVPKANSSNLHVIQGLSWFSEFEDQGEWKIEQEDLPEGEPYAIIRDIPVKITRDGVLDFTATFEDANISIGGIHQRDAFQALVYEILDLFDYLAANSNTLGPEPQRQLAVLSEHIVKING